MKSFFFALRWTLTGAVLGLLMLVGGLYIAMLVEPNVFGQLSPAALPSGW